MEEEGEYMQTLFFDYEQLSREREDYQSAIVSVLDERDIYRNIIPFKYEDMQ